MIIIIVKKKKKTVYLSLEFYSSKQIDSKNSEKFLKAI